jgi:hypothetical protein
MRLVQKIGQATCIDRFIDASGIAPPFHLVAISAKPARDRDGSAPSIAAWRDDLLQPHHRGAQDKYEQCTERRQKRRTRCALLTPNTLNWRHCQFGKLNSWLILPLPGLAHCLEPWRRFQFGYAVHDRRERPRRARAGARSRRQPLAKIRREFSAATAVSVGDRG